MGHKNEAVARIKINRLLQDAGWRLLDNEDGKANVLVEKSTKIDTNDESHLTRTLDKLGFLDYLLLDQDRYPFVVLEAKKSATHPLAGKEQARAYAKSQNCKLVILSNGDHHYLWDIESGNPEQFTKFPTQEELIHRHNYKPNPIELHTKTVDTNYLAPARVLRDYQVDAIHAIQQSVKDGNQRFLLEMATGTGKTTTAAGICKLFLETGNAKRILFLVDRIELETQACEGIGKIFEGKYFVRRIKDKDWRSGHIIVSTIQTLMASNRYRDLFSPIDFELVISDEAHRGLSGNSRAIFEYFIGYKLGLTATPKDYMKGIDTVDLQYSDPKKLELRNLRDTYKTFGCESGKPTYRYDLNNGVQDGFLLPPKVVDVRSEVTTQLLSEEGFVVDPDDTNDEETVYKIKDFEKKFFNKRTNILFCQTIIDKALKDPFTGETGKTIIFCVSQNHAAKITNILNLLSHERFPGIYESNFAQQVTSSVQNAQEYTESFAGNKLHGNSKFGQDKFPDYKTSKARICVTVGMMTTGYDCPDLLNIALLRPIYSPSDFIQMKGRGTRKHTFTYKETGETKDKEYFLLLDFFANCEYFEEKFNYDEKITLSLGGGGGGEIPGPSEPPKNYDANTQDKIESLIEIMIGEMGMKIDRELYPERYKQFEKVIQEHPSFNTARENQDIESIAEILQYEVFDKPSEYWNAQKIRESYETEHKLNRKLSLHEMILKALGLLEKFKSREQRIEEEFQKYLDIHELSVKPPENTEKLKTFFESYLADKHFREIMDKREFGLLASYPAMSMEDLGDIITYTEKVQEYINEYLVREKDEFNWN